MEDKELLYDHYKDTFEQQKGYLHKRDRLMLLILICVILLLACVHDPSLVTAKINTALDSVIKDLNFDFKYLNTFLVFVTLWVVVQYYQVIFLIEKMYYYLDLTEKKLTQTCRDAKISREGSFYLTYNSWFSDLMDVCYVYLFPIAIAIIAIVKICKEWNWFTRFRIVDIVGLSLLAVISVLYIIARRSIKQPTEL